jgi:hypothetical protein
MPTKRNDPLYARLKTENKKWLYRKMKSEGFESMSLWLDLYIEKLKQKEKAHAHRSKNRTS